MNKPQGQIAKPRPTNKGSSRWQLKPIAMGIAMAGSFGMGGCAGGKGGPTISGAGSAQEAVDAYAEAVLGRDYASIVAHSKPSLQKEYQKVVAAHRWYVEAGRAAITKLRVEHGKDAASRFNLIVVVPHERMLTGVLLWEGPSRSGTVKPASHGDTPIAYPIMAEGVNTGLVVEPIRGKWYVGPGPSRYLTADMRAYGKLLRAATDDFSHLSTEELLHSMGPPLEVGTQTHTRGARKEHISDVDSRSERVEHGSQ